MLEELRKAPPSRRGKGGRAEKGQLSTDELRDLYRLYTRARAESWEALARELPGGNLTPVTLTDLLLVELLREQFNELANEGNPLRKWLEFSRSRLRDKRQDRKPGGPR